MIAGLNLSASYWLAAGCLLAFLSVLWVVCGTKRFTDADGQAAQVRRFWYLVLGADDRVSTSKVQFALWTLALAYALLVIVFHESVYPPGTLDPRYLLLLGVPAGAAVGAKLVTTGQIASGTVGKKADPSPKKNLTGAIREVVADDQGNLDLGDAQYFIFNLVALTTFFIAFVHDPVRLPVLPDTLVGLTSASAAAYVAKKAAAPSPPSITAVSPLRGPVNTPIRIFGANLGDGVAPPDAVTIGGLEVSNMPRAMPTEIDVSVPEGLGVGLVDIQVVTSDGSVAKLANAYEVTE